MNGLQALLSVTLAVLLGYAAAQQVKPDAATFSSCRGGTGAYYQMFTKEGGVRGAPRYTYIAADIELAGGDASSVRITPATASICSAGARTASQRLHAAS